MGVTKQVKRSIQPHLDPATDEGTRETQISSTALAVSFYSRCVIKIFTDVTLPNTDRRAGGLLAQCSVRPSKAFLLSPFYG